LYVVVNENLSGRRRYTLLISSSFAAVASRFGFGEKKPSESNVPCSLWNAKSAKSSLSFLVTFECPCHVSAK
jgi:hypothetical protein